MRSFDIIVAVDEGLGIGKGGGLPWDLPSEMAHFVRTTTRTESESRQNAVFMGRTNWEAIPSRYQPLPRRLNVVLTRKAGYELPHGVLRCSSIEQCLTELDGPPWSDRIERVFCIGGGQIYTQALKMPQCERLLLTRIHQRYDCDTFFPPFEHAFELADVIGTGEDEGVTYEVQLWTRR